MESCPEVMSVWCGKGISQQQSSAAQRCAAAETSESTGDGPCGRWPPFIALPTVVAEGLDWLASQEVSTWNRLYFRIGLAHIVQ
jgi:hypothetical protein